MSKLSHQTTVDRLIVQGAKVHNLKDISLSIPKNKLVVFTGLSGSGKSSLAFDTIFAEGQRRYIESLSSYARQFLGLMQKPEVDKIIGLSPAIAIDQKTVSHNPRSTVGTVTEIYDYLRLLFARVGQPHCLKCGRPIKSQSAQEIVDQVMARLAHEKPPLTKVMVLAPLSFGDPSKLEERLARLTSLGYLSFRLDGRVKKFAGEIDLPIDLKTIEVVIDRLVLSTNSQARLRLSEAIEAALRLTGGQVMVGEILDVGFDIPKDPKKVKSHFFSEHFACSVCHTTVTKPQARDFSFNSPYGACGACHGLGVVMKADREKVFNLKLTFAQGAVLPWFYHIEFASYQRDFVLSKVKKFGFDMNTPIAQAPSRLLDEIYEEGVKPWLLKKYAQKEELNEGDRLLKFFTAEPCPVCKGARLKPESLAVKLDGFNIAQVSALSIVDILEWLKGLPQKLESRQAQIATPVVNELIKRVGFLKDVGLGYLTLDRSSATLSGGEAQRIRLASQIGSQLSGVIYVLDEPSIGLHPRDHHRLLETLKHLKGLGNTVIVVEHDLETITSADYIVDFGPGAGEAGGKIVVAGTLPEIIRNRESLTGQYLAGKKQVFAHHQSRSVDERQQLKLIGAKKHNLRDVDITIPIGNLTVVTGVSGSGKSSLIMETLYPALKKRLGGFISDLDGAKNLKGWEYFKRVSVIDQSPIGRTPRSNPATYTKVFDLVRALFAKLPLAQERGYRPGRFSFNVKGGRCEYCKGEGVNRISMQFLPDVYVTCDRCQGTRYQPETLEITYKGKNIAQVLDLTVDQAYEFFKKVPSIAKKLKTLQEVGLGYIKLGQSAPTLSGGEAQRVKLAAELAKKSKGQTIYILDEPTTGLHFHDIDRLLKVLHHLVDEGNTMIIIEHNLDVIKTADWIIDLGPEGGDAGGQVVYMGDVTGLVKCQKSYTGKFLKKLT